MQKRKNQHFVPQFYLKNFSISNNKTSVGLFNLKTNSFIANAEIKHQASKKFFYGKDGRVEEGLSKLENLLAPQIKAVLDKECLPGKYSEEYFSILIFTIISELRSPTNINRIKNFGKILNEELKKSNPENDIMPEMPDEMAIELSFSTYEDCLKMSMDLDFKILLNETDMPFITSDLPVIKYNQFLEDKVSDFSNTGYASLGLQILIPLSPRVYVIFYDPQIYKVGNRKDKMVMVNESDVDQLNLVQFINGGNTLFFDDRINEYYMQKLSGKSNKFRKANETMLSTHEMVVDVNIKENSQILHLKYSDPNIKLRLSKIKLLRKANSGFSYDGSAPMRQKARILIEHNEKVKNNSKVISSLFS